MAPPPLRRPLALRSGDRIGVFAPAFPTAALFPARFEAGVAAIKQEFGAEVVVPSHVREAHGDRSAAPQDVAASFTELICDPSVGAVIATIGGHGAAELLGHLDAAVLAENPTVLVGYSDVTSLLLGIQALAGWCTFHGPTLMTDLAEAPRPDPFTMQSLRAAITVPAPMGNLHDPETWSAEFLDWGTDSWRRGRSPQGSGARTVWRSGVGRGRTFGGNLATLVHMTGTPYLAPSDELVLLLETTGDLTSHATVRQALVHLDQAGLLPRARAVLVGRCPEMAAEATAAIRATLLELLDPSVPVVADLAFGHHSPIWTIPLGVEAAVDATDRRSTISILEAGVA